MNLRCVKLVGILVLMFGGFASIVPRGFAQDIGVVAEVSSRSISLGSAVNFSITVQGSQDVKPIQLPKIEGFDVSYSGPSTRVSIVNGQYSSSKTFTYSLFPLKEGTFTIPAISVVVSGKTYTTQPISIEVGGSVQQAVSSSQNSQPVNLRDKLFMAFDIPKKEIYLNERLPIKIFVLYSDLSVSDVQYPQFDHTGFSMDEYEEPKQYQQVLNGVRYNVIEFDTVIYPTRTGPLNLGPATTQCNLLVEGPSRRRSLFNDDFFDSFFGRQEKRPMALKSEAVAINVLPLPGQGKPADFSGAVGKFDFNVSVGPTEVKEGDPITVRETVIGKGNLAAIEIPSLSSSEDDFKGYDPQIFEKDNIKKSEQVIIPRSEKIKEIPAIHFSYFDPDLKAYQTITRGPFPITVKKLEKGEEFKVVGLENEGGVVEPETLGKDIVFIKKDPGQLRAVGAVLYKNGLFYVLIFFYGVLWSAFFIYHKRSDRIKTDVVYARRLQAPRQARQGLVQAKKLMMTGEKEEFYDTVFKTIQQYLGNKLHLSSGAVTLETVQSYLKDKSITQKIIDDIKLTYDECDMIRYASAEINQEKMDASYQRLAQIIDHLERFLK